jgi:hypothetical protein
MVQLEYDDKGLINLLFKLMMFSCNKNHKALYKTNDAILFISTIVMIKIHS